MDRWQNKVAVVTGASAGIGATIVKSLLQANLTVVGLARRKEKILEIRDSLPKEKQSRLHAVKCDITNEGEVKYAFDWIEKNLGGTDILVNNAGVVRNKTCLISPGNTADMKEIVDTNIMGFLYCTREAFNSMKARNFDGHIIVINSVLGHKVANFIGSKAIVSTNMYSPSKYAVTAMVETYRQEFANAGTKVKITVSLYFLGCNI